MNTVTLTDSQNDSIVASLFVSQHRVERQLKELEAVVDRFLETYPRENLLASGSPFMLLAAKRQRLLSRRAELSELVRIFVVE